MKRLSYCILAVLALLALTSITFAGGHGRQNVNGGHRQNFDHGRHGYRHGYYQRFYADPLLFNYGYNPAQSLVVVPGYDAAYQARLLAELAALRAQLYAPQNYVAPAPVVQPQAAEYVPAPVQTQVIPVPTYAPVRRVVVPVEVHRRHYRRPAAVVVPPAKVVAPAKVVVPAAKPGY